MANDFLKQVSSVVSTRNEVRTLTSVTTTNLVYTKVDRTDLSERLTHYYRSVNLPASSGDFLTGSSLSLSFPELQQLNVDKFIIASIPKENYAEIIDGRSVSWSFPYYTGGTLSSVTLVSSTYGSFAKKQDNPLIGNNVSFLFSDALNLPYTGTTDGGIITKSANSTWNTTNYLSRPAAVSYQNLQPADVNTDQRPYSGVSLPVDGIPENYPTTTNQGYNYDVPVGFAVLDKGLMVVTHPFFVDNFPWVLGRLASTTALNSASATTGIYFTDTANSSISYYSIDIAYQTSVVCIALPDEFFFTNNPTWDYSTNLSALQEGSNDFDTTYVTEIGLYNKNNELVAITKLDRPKEKGYTGLLTFTLKLDV